MQLLRWKRRYNVYYFGLAHRVTHAFMLPNLNIELTCWFEVGKAYALKYQYFNYLRLTQVVNCNIVLIGGYVEMAK